MGKLTYEILGKYASVYWLVPTPNIGRFLNLPCSESCYRARIDFFLLVDDVCGLDGELEIADVNASAPFGDECPGLGDDKPCLVGHFNSS